MTTEIYRITRDIEGACPREDDEWVVYCNGEYIGSAPDRTSAEQIKERHMKAEAEKTQ